ncbi:MAG: hypothetical protein IJ535_10045 [Pseudobutyrivibrio sp.]|uniref:ATP-binding protein n=1 Tax=Pseudobutyrivibrio sp. TaxID=2014367 RepID=UPI0026012835|nr:ATP-binding protein [Pseudobutyrivibrio sp.]MBQ8490106.1 hypothetical protein [Pseudobutyrivibrio sp.]
MFDIFKKFLLVSALIFYVITLFSFFSGDSTVFLFFFILHSITLMLFALFSNLKKDTSEEDAEEYVERIQNIKTQWREETESLKKQLNEKIDSTTSLEEQIVSDNMEIVKLKEKIDELNQAIDDAKKAAIETKSNANEDELALSVLPSYLPEKSMSTTINIIDVAKAVAKEFHDDAIKAGLTLTVSSTEESLLVKADANLIRILFRNIIDNSIKYMNRRGSLIITISSVADDIFVVCKDNGDGLAPEETKHIFELNYQGSNRISGNGLGLFQAKAIVTYYGGTIYAKSNSGAGMGIYIQLPTT